MIVAVSMLVAFAVGAFVAWPLLRPPGDQPEERTGGTELWKREKSVAVLAITEADFDLATGKLSDDDYRVLRADYEGRALQAMEELDRLAEPGSTPAAAGGQARFCGGCGQGFAPADAFCGGCGAPRGALL